MFGAHAIFPAFDCREAIKVNVKSSFVVFENHARKGFELSMVEAAYAILIPCFKEKHADVTIDCERSLLVAAVDVERPRCLKVHPFGDVPIDHCSIEPPVGNICHNPRCCAIIFRDDEKASIAARIEDLRGE